MSFYDTDYEYGGYPVYVGTGFDEAWYMGLPPLSYVNQYDAITKRDRIEISSKDLLFHAVAFKAMDWGATFALRKGFLDAAMMGYAYQGRLYGSFAMGARRVLWGGIGHGVRAASPAIAGATSVLAGAWLVDAFMSWLNPDISILPDADFMRWTQYA